MGNAGSKTASCFRASQPFSLVLYPELCNLWLENKEKFKYYFLVSFLGCVTVGGVFVLIYYFSVEIIEMILLGNTGGGVDVLLKAQAPLVLILILNVIFNSFAMACGDENEIKNIYMRAAAIFVFVSFFAAKNYMGLGVLGVVGIIEVWVFVNLFLVIRKRGV